MPVPFVESTWPEVPAVAGTVIVHAPPTGLTKLKIEPALLSARPLRVATPEVKLPEASRLTIVDAVFKLVAAFAATVAVFTLAAVEPPTVATVGFGYVPVRSPAAAPEGALDVGSVNQLKFPRVSDERTWPPVAATAGGNFKTYDVVTVVGADKVTVFRPVSLYIDDVCVIEVPVTGPVETDVDVKTPALILPAVKAPVASRFTIVDAVFKLVAAFAKFAPVATLAAVTPPTELTVATAEPEPEADTSPVKAEIPVPAGVVQDKTPEPFVVKTWLAPPAVVGKVKA